jgi:MoxR-like ATPase
MSEYIKLAGQSIFLSPPECLPGNSKFVGREDEIKMCRAAMHVNENYELLQSKRTAPLHFRLEGPPGVGKNEIVYEIARRLGLPFYSIQGHSELTPEDLALLLTPDAETSRRNLMSFVLRASPLGAAIYHGGFFFFDEINRVPEKALSPLASVLDSRRHIYSAMTGIRIEPKDDKARRSFRFCCALNPALSETGFSLPDYIEQRTLPVIKVGYPSFEQMREIIVKKLTCSKRFITAFERWYGDQTDHKFSVREILSLMNFTMILTKQEGGREFDIINRAASFMFNNQRHSDQELLN